MDKDEKGENGGDSPTVLQWGSTKRHRCGKVKSREHDKTSDVNKAFSPDTLMGNKKDGCPDTVLEDKKESDDHRETDKETASKSTRNLGLPTNKRNTARSPQKEDRYPYYTTRGSLALDENGNARASRDYFRENKGGPVMPKLSLSLSSKEKEEDFIAMKVSRLPQRPKKRPKSIQRSVHLASPGTWLPDVSQDRYEVREKKTSKKRPKGLKAMVGCGSDSE